MRNDREVDPALAPESGSGKGSAPKAKKSEKKRIYQIAKELFDELYDHHTPIRKLGVRVSELQQNTYVQQALFVNYDFDKQKQIDLFVDDLRSKYGKDIIQRASFLHSGLKPVTGGIGEEGYPVMTSIL